MKFDQLLEAIGKTKKNIIDELTDEQFLKCRAEFTKFIVAGAGNSELNRVLAQFTDQIDVEDVTTSLKLIAAMFKTNGFTVPRIATHSAAKHAVSGHAIGKWVVPVTRVKYYDTTSSQWVEDEVTHVDGELKFTVVAEFEHGVWAVRTNSFIQHLHGTQSVRFHNVEKYDKKYIIGGARQNIKTPEEAFEVAKKYIETFKKKFP
jgi:hypothetical protein